MELKVDLCGVDVTVEGDDYLCLDLIKCGEKWRVVIDNKVRHELPQNLREEEEDI